MPCRFCHRPVCDSGTALGLCRACYSAVYRMARKPLADRARWAGLWTIAAGLDRRVTSKRDSRLRLVWRKKSA